MEVLGLPIHDARRRCNFGRHDDRVGNRGVARARDFYGEYQVMRGRHEEVPESPSPEPLLDAEPARELGRHVRLAAH